MGANLGFTTINTAGGAYTASVFQTAGAPNEVNVLLSSAGQFVQSFDGTDLTGAVAGAQGGAGSWGGTTTNWGAESERRAERPLARPGRRFRRRGGWWGGERGGAAGLPGPAVHRERLCTDGRRALNAIGNSVAGGNAMASFLNIDAGVTATIASSITSANGVGLDKLGRGTLVLTGANSYSGLTDIQAGVVEIRNGAALGVGDGLGPTGTRVRTDAALEIASGITVANEALTLSGTGIANGGAMRSLSGSNAWNGPITLEATSRINTDAGTLTIGGQIGGAGRDLTIGGGGNTIVNGVIGTGPGTLTHDGAGTLTLNGANSFTGLTTNIGGTLANNGSLSGGVSNAAIFTNAGTVAGGLANALTATNLATGAIQQGVTNGGAFTNFGTVNGGLVNMAMTQGLAMEAAPPGTAGSGFFENAGTLNGGLVNMAKASNLASGVIQQGVTNGASFDSKGTINGGLINEGQVQAAGQLSGAIINRSTGTFAVTGALGGAMPSFDNAGIVSIGAGDIAGIGAFSNSGLLMARDGGARRLGAASFTNQATGVISQANGTLSDVLSITGNYVGAPGSRIAQDINLALPRGEATNGDRIIVGGSASGATTFVFTPTNGNRAAFGTPIPVFTTGGENNLTTNEGRIGPLGQGFFDYFLRRNATRNGFEIASFYNSSPAAGVAGSLGGLTSSQQASFHQSFSSIVPRATDCRPNQAVGSPFIRMSASNASTKADSAGEMAGGGLAFSSATRSGTNLRGFQTGFDIGICNIAASGWTVRAGVMGGVADMAATSSSRAPTPMPGLEVASRTRATANVPFVGLYSLVTNGSFTAEFDVRRDFYDIKLTSSDASTGFTFVNPHQKLKGDGLSFNGSLSYRIAIGERFHLEPQIGLSKARTSFGLLPFATSSQDFMRIDPLASLMGRVGLNAGANFQVADKLVLTPFVSGSLWHEFARPGRTLSFIGTSGQSFAAETERTGTFGMVGAGLQLSQADAALSGYMRGDVRFGDGITGKALNAGLRLAF